MNQYTKNLEVLNSYVDWVRDSLRNDEIQKCAGEHVKTIGDAAKWRALCKAMGIREDAQPFVVATALAVKQKVKDKQNVRKN